jgi:hypothetical protein
MSFELSRDEIAASSQVTDVGTLTDGFFHKRYNWIKRNQVLASMISDGSKDVTVGLAFVNGYLMVKAAGPVMEVAKLITALGKGWQVQWNGGEHTLKIGTEAECEEANESRRQHVRTKNVTEDKENGERKLRVLGLPPSFHLDESVAAKARAVCETFCVKVPLMISG